VVNDPGPAFLVRLPRIVAVIALLSVASLSYPRAVEQPWYVDYDNAIKAVENGEYVRAEVVLRDLIAGNGVSRADVFTYASWTVDYTPYYYLGLALKGRKQIQEAKAAFGLELQFGVVQRNDEKMQIIRGVQSGAEDSQEDAVTER
jgi:hypothetical protein